MRRVGLSMLAVVIAFGINLLAANEKPSDAMKAVMNANAAANTTARDAMSANRLNIGTTQSFHDAAWATATTVVRRRTSVSLLDFSRLGAQPSRAGRRDVLSLSGCRLPRHDRTGPVLETEG